MKSSKLRHLPVVDVADADRPDTLRAIDAACREWGFFQVVGHRIDRRKIAALQLQMRSFFMLPPELKQQIVRTAENPWGFYDRELTRHTPDWKQIFDVGPPDGANIVPQWPASMPEFRLVMEDFRAVCTHLAMRILGAIAHNLGVPAHVLALDFCGAHTSFLRLNYYPRCPSPARPADRSPPKEGHLGISPHTDSGALTILLQDEQSGLEILHDDDWYLVEPLRDALVVNIGDIVQVWSNDAYHAALHRVLVQPHAERFTAAFFLNPSYGAEYAPLPTMIDAGHPARYRPINWGEFRARRAAGDYAHAGEYAEISQYQL
jgi:isopenicillin N synthase-like dioxygenase